MEYSKSPRTPAQCAVGLVCNVARVLNNIHPLVPIVVAASLVAGIAWGVARLL